MKKIISIVIAAVLILAVPVCASAEIDLSGLSWQELIDLRAAIMREQMSRDEWQEVVVPKGVYIVGEDIPAGKWTIRPAEGLTDVSFGEKLRENGLDIAWSGVWGSESASGDDSFTLDLKDGFYVVVSFGKAIFAPFTGKPALGFK